MTTPSRQGGRQGAAQGGREFSLTDSLTYLPPLNGANGTQGGANQDAVNTGKTPETRDENTPEESPSPALEAETGSAVVSRCVTKPAQRASDDDVTVQLPAEPPTLTTSVARALVAILVELTTIEILNPPVQKETE